jgi:hypothetical protein
VGDYPFKAVYLHFHFSRLTLNSLALRTYHSATSVRPLSAERKKYAEIAINSAISTLTVVLEEPDIQKSLVGVPLFLHSMITFASVFLLKIVVKVHPSCVTAPGNPPNSIASAGLRIDVPRVLSIVERIVDLMVSISEQASERHVSHHIARGLGKMMDGFREWERRNPLNAPLQQRQQQHPSWLHETPSLYNPVAMAGSQALGGRDTILNHPPPMLGVAPLSAERGNTNHHEFAPSANASASEKPRMGLSEGSLDPTMADLWGFDEEYFPTGVFDFLQSQMPA